MQAKRSWVAVAVGLVGLAVLATPSSALAESCGAEGICKTDSPDPVQAGGQITYTVIVDSGGPIPSSDIDVTDPIPAGTTFVSVTSPVFLCSAPAFGAGPPATVSCFQDNFTGGTLTLTLVVAVDPEATGAIENTATLRAVPDAAPDQAFEETAPETTTVDPDPDGDGVPDSSDACPGQPGPPENGGCPLPPVDPTGADTTPPNTTITKGPKDKAKKKTATFEFTGTDARVIAGFECKLDAEAFRACSSPVTYKVKKGKHTFQVQAVDQAGNVGPPATDDWKVKKKRKK